MSKDEEGNIYETFSNPSDSPVGRPGIGAGGAVRRPAEKEKETDANCAGDLRVDTKQDADKQAACQRSDEQPDKQPAGERADE